MGQPNTCILARLLYNLFVLLQQSLFGFAAAWNPKAALWTSGRQNWRQRMRSRLIPGKKRIWMHVASLGEFEQALPLIDRLRTHYPDAEIMLTFFSPSGFELRKNEERVHHVFYLPSDLARNARDFIEIVDPILVIFIKYEFWYNYLRLLHAKKIPVILVSAAFMPQHSFFQWWGGFFRSMLKYYAAIFVQDAYNQQLLQTIGISENVMVAGDTRYDRVVSIADSVTALSKLEAFCQHHPLLVAGSTWPDDERLLKELLTLLPPDWKMIIAPHEVDTSHIDKLTQLFGDNYVLYSMMDEGKTLTNSRVLIIDNIGLLSRIYAYGALSYVGGGFRKRGLHNILEPAAFGLPVLIGPEYRNFVEAIRFVQEKYAFPVNNAGEAASVIHKLTADPAQRQALRHSIRSFMQQQTGAAEKVIQFIDDRQWLAQ